MRSKQKFININSILKQICQKGKKREEVFKTIKQTVEEICVFVLFHIYSSLYKNYLDFEINNNIANINNNPNTLNIINEYFICIIVFIQ